MITRHLILVSTLALLAAALQKPERHFGCVQGKNVCIYPIDTANMQCNTFFDFQVALHLPVGAPINPDWRQEMDIKLYMPSGDVLTPENVFNKQPVLRNWTLEVFEDSADETPDGYESYAVTYRNVMFPQKFGKGHVKVSVYARGVRTEVMYLIREPTRRRAKNVILFVGDGMALPMMSAARLVSRGMVHGKFNDLLFIEKFPHFGLQNPSGVDSIITDSANSASSMNTGHKSSVNALGVYADSGDDNFGHPKHENIAEHIKRNFNMSVGVVTTAEVQDATPAAVWAHTRRRAEKAIITAQALNGCDDCVLAVQPDVLMGGGGRFFIPEGSVDGSNMYKNYSRAGYTVTHTREEMLAAADDPNTKKLLTVSHAGNMEVWLDRNVFKENMNVSENSPTGDGVPPMDQPNLDEMVMSAIKVLSKNENGFYLQVEAASIDKSAHPLDVPRTLSDLIEMDNTVGQVVEWAKTHGEDTLIIVTADHAHGYDVFGTVDRKVYEEAVIASEEQLVSDADHLCAPVVDNAGNLFTNEIDETTGARVRKANQARRTAFGIYSGAGFPDYVDENGDNFPDSWDVRTVLASGMNNFPDHTDDYRVSSSIKTPVIRTENGALNNPEDAVNGIFLSGNLPPFERSGVHTMQDVGIFGYGPGAERVTGIMDNTEIYHIIASALGFGTDGMIDENDYLFDGVVRCVNDDERCHCMTGSDGAECACRRNGAETFVRPATRLCSKGHDGKPMI